MRGHDAHGARGVTRRDMLHNAAVLVHDHVGPLVLSQRQEAHAGELRLERR
jgi:hypothetical protein